MLHNVDCQFVTDVAGQPIRLILRVKQSKKNDGDIRHVVMCRMVCVGGDWFSDNTMLANRVSGTLRRGQGGKKSSCLRGAVR